MNKKTNAVLAAATPRGPAMEALIRAITSQTDVLSAGRARALLLNARLGVDDLMPWARFDHPLTDSYGRTAVAVSTTSDGSPFELMVMSWLPGDYSAIHDHGTTQWGAVRYFGHAEHIVFHHAGDHLRTRERSFVDVGDVAQVDHDLIHQMGNPGDEPFLSLHLYGCAHAHGAVTANARVFDLLERRVLRTDGGVFYGLPREQINSQEPGPGGDGPTAVRDHHHALRRIERVRRAGVMTADLWQRRARLLSELGVENAGDGR